MPSHYLNQCCNIVNWKLRNKFQWNSNWNFYIFSQENVFENVVRQMAAILSLLQFVKEQWTCICISYDSLNFCIGDISDCWNSALRYSRAYIISTVLCLLMSMKSGIRHGVAVNRLSRLPCHHEKMESLTVHIHTLVHMHIFTCSHSSLVKLYFFMKCIIFKMKGCYCLLQIW